MGIAAVTCKMLALQRRNLLAVIDALDDAALDARPFDGAQTIHETLLHLVRCYEFYTTSAMAGTMEPAPYRPPAYHSLSELTTLVNRVCEASSGRVAGYPDEALEETVTYNGAEVTRAACLLEMLIHAQHHIGQLQFTLRQIGRQPADVKFLV